VGDIDHRNLPTLLLQDIDPLVAVLRHRRGIARPAVADIFVHDRERAQIAIRALRDVNDHFPFLPGVPPASAHAANYFAGTSCAAFSVSRTSLSFSMRAKVSDMCSMRPS